MLSLVQVCTHDLVRAERKVVELVVEDPNSMYSVTGAKFVNCREKNLWVKEALNVIFC